MDLLQAGLRREPGILLTADASDSGWGVQVGDLMAKGPGSVLQFNWHINRKEIFVFYTAI